MAMTAQIFWLSDSSDSSVTVKTNNCHCRKCIHRKGLTLFGDSSDSTFKFLAPKNKLSRWYIYIYIDYSSVYIEWKQLSLLSLVTIKALKPKGFLSDSCNKQLSRNNHFLNRTVTFLKAIGLMVTIKQCKLYIG